MCFVFVCFSINSLSGVTSSDLKLFLNEYLKNSNELSEIAYAVENGYEDIAILYLKKSSKNDLFYKINDVSYKSVLTTSIRMNYFKLFKLILSMYPSESNAIEYNYRLLNGIWMKTKQYRAVNIAIMDIENTLPFLQELVMSGVDLNRSDQSIPESGFWPSHPKDFEKAQLEYHRTPLLAAIEKNKMDVIKFLLTCGVDPNPGIPFAIKINNLVVAEFLLQCGSANKESLQTAVKANNIEAVILLINYGITDVLDELELALTLHFYEIADLLAQVATQTY